MRVRRGHRPGRSTPACFEGRRRRPAVTGGAPLRLRLAGPGDATAVAALLAVRGVDASAADIAALLAFDPTQRAVVCALDGRGSVVAIGAIDLREDADPDTLVAAHAGLAALLGAALYRRARGRDAHVA